VLAHDSFYRFVVVDDPDLLRHRAQSFLNARDVLGTVLIAPEGINVMLCGPVEALDSAREWFESDERFPDLFVKRTACESMVFHRLKVKVKREIVPLGLEGIDATRGGWYAASPKEWEVLVQRDDVIVIDNRNSFEFGHGRFKNAIDPGVNNFREFAAFFEDHLDEWADKTIAMYCTGGIRCDKTAAWASERGVAIVTLNGGILNYLQQSDDPTSIWEGNCFVFDDRRELDATLAAVPQIPDNPAVL
jgi:UPF0176 protein